MCWKDLIWTIPSLNEYSGTVLGLVVRVRVRESKRAKRRGEICVGRYVWGDTYGLGMGRYVGGGKY